MENAGQQIMCTEAGTEPQDSRAEATIRRYIAAASGDSQRWKINISEGWRVEDVIKPLLKFINDLHLENDEWDVAKLTLGASYPEIHRLFVLPSDHCGVECIHDVYHGNSDAFVSAFDVSLQQIAVPPTVEALLRQLFKQVCCIEYASCCVGPDNTEDT